MPATFGALPRCGKRYRLLLETFHKSGTRSRRPMRCSHARKTRPRRPRRHFPFHGAAEAAAGTADPDDALGLGFCEGRAGVVDDPPDFADELAAGEAIAKAPPSILHE